MYYDITGVILAGGESNRMGQNKALIEITGRSLIESATELFKTIFSETIIVSKNPGAFLKTNCREIADNSKEKGAIIGLASAIEASKTPYIFVTACDMPFLDRKIIELIIEKSHNHMVTLPYTEGKLHPLHAVYSAACLPFINKYMESGQKSLCRFISSLPEKTVKKIGEREILLLDPSLESLFNMNTPEEMKMAEKTSENRKQRPRDT